MVISSDWTPKTINKDQTSDIQWSGGVGDAIITVTVIITIDGESFTFKIKNDIQVS